MSQPIDDTMDLSKIEILEDGQYPAAALGPNDEMLPGQCKPLMWTTGQHGMRGSFRTAILNRLHCTALLVTGRCLNLGCDLREKQTHAGGDRWRRRPTSASLAQPRRASPLASAGK